MLWLLALVAHAIPFEMNQQGRVLDAAGVPVNGAHALTFRVYDAPTLGAVQWTESFAGVAIVDGTYAVTLGQTTPLDTAVFTGATRYLSVAVDGVEVSPRTAVVAVPYAVRAAEADHVNPAALVTSGELDDVAVTGSYTSLADTPTTLANLSCADGQVLKRVSGVWACADDIAVGCPTGTVRMTGFCIQPITNQPFGQTWWAAMASCQGQGLRLCDQGEVVTSLQAGVLHEYPFATRDAWYHTSSQAENSPGAGGENQVCDVQANPDQPGHPQYSVQCQHEKSWSLAANGSGWRTTICCY